jgi:hypothetical protein
MEEGRPNDRALRRAVCFRINTQLRLQYEAVLGEEIPARFVALLNQLDEPRIPEERASANAT